MNVLITSGGGAKGAFSVGALKVIRRAITRFDLISGTSTGSLIAAMVAAGRTDALEDVYRNTVNADILRPDNLIENMQRGLPYIYDTGPLQQQIERHIDAAAFAQVVNSGMPLCLNAVSLQTGRITVFTTAPVSQNPALFDVRPVTDHHGLVQALLASSNQAAFMKPVELDGQQFADGGNREVIPSRVVVSNLSFTEDHTIFVLSNNPHELMPVAEKFTSFLSVLFRAVSLFIQEVRENDLDLLSSYKFRSQAQVRIFYIHPAEELDPDFPTGLRFDKLRMRHWMQLGEARAADILARFPEGNFGLIV